MKTGEQILAEGCGRGDNAARRELYDRYAALLLGLCQRYVGDRATAEDVLHDAFLKIFGAIGRFRYRGEGSLRAWMERIAVNTALEHLRRERRLGEVRLEESRGALRRRGGPHTARGAAAPCRRASRRLPDGLQPLLHRGIPAPRDCRHAGHQREELLVAAGPGPGASGAETPRVVGYA